MTSGRSRITTLDAKGRAQVEDVSAGDLWCFPAGLPHSLHGLGPHGAEFVLAFDTGTASEFNTLLLTDWMAHAPPEVLGKNLRVPAEAFKTIPLTNRWIFQDKVPGARSADQQAAHVEDGCGRPGHAAAGELARDAPAPERRRVAAIRQGRGPHDGVQHWTEGSPLRLRHSQSLASRRQRFSQPMVLSTIHRAGRTTNVPASGRLTISTFTCRQTRFSPCWKFGPV